MHLHPFDFSRAQPWYLRRRCRHCRGSRRLRRRRQRVQHLHQFLRPCFVHLCLLRRRLLLLCLISVVFRVWWCFQPSLHLSHHFLRRVFVRVRLQKVVHQTEQIEIRRFFVFVFSSSSSSLSLLLPIGRRGSPLFFWTRRQSRRHDLMMSKGRATHTRFLNALFFLRFGRKKKRALLMI